MKDRKTIAIVIGVGIGTFMSALDTSVINLALPRIMAEFGVTRSTVEWVLTAYLLVVSSMLLTYGRLSDLYGQKRIYQTGLVIFIGASALCGLSNSIVMLITGRVIQALGAGMLYATGPAIITNAVSPEHRGRALSVAAISVALGLTAGPVIGGLLTTHVGWPSIFYINVPIGIVAMVVIAKNVPKSTVKNEKVPFDVLGSVLVFAALLLILLPLSLSGNGGGLSGPVFALMAIVGVLLIVVFVFYELRHRHPMLEIRLFKNRVFAGSSAAALFIYMANFTLMIILQFYFQELRLFAPDVSGLLYLPMPLAGMLIAPISGTLSDKMDSRFISAFGAFTMAAGLLMLSFLNTETSIAYVIVALALTGLGFGLFQTPNNSAIMGNVPMKNRGSASSVMAIMRNIGMALGVAVSVALFERFHAAAEAAGISSGLTGDALFNSAFVTGVQNTFRVAVLIALLSMTASLLKGRAIVKPEEKPPAE